MKPARLTVFCLVALSIAMGGATAAAGPPVRQSSSTTQDQDTPEEPSEPKWTLEIFGGGAVNTRPTKGSSSLPSTSSLIAGRISASSFYFGSGAQAISQFAGALGGPPITALDGVLAQAAIERRQLGGTFGARVGRAIGSRFAVEIAGEFSPSDFSFSDAARAGIDRSRTTYIPTLTRALAPLPSTVVTSATFTPQTAQQLFATGVLEINTRTTGRAIPYIALGAGVALNLGDTPSMTLKGTSQVGTSAQIIQTDTVTLHYSVKDRTLVGVGGAGVKYSLGKRWGLRLDGRALLYKDSTVSLADATPDIALTSTGSPFPLLNSGTLQFSSTAPMNGPSIFNHPTFVGNGIQAHISATAGLFLRF